MGLDIRWPIGLMFLLLGIVLAAYGLMSDATIYAQSLGMNVNLIWGAVLAVFGLLMIALARWGRKTKQNIADDRPATTRGPAAGVSPAISRSQNAGSCFSRAGPNESDWRAHRLQRWVCFSRSDRSRNVHCNCAALRPHPENSFRTFQRNN